VGGDARDADLLFQRLQIGLGAGEGGQERWVDADDAVLVAEDHVRREDAYVPREDDEVGVVL